MKILTILGARPQFIKAAAVSRAIRSHNDIEEVIVHTGQHFDKNMSEVFFEQLDVPRPQYNLNISSLSHGAMTGRMLEKLESIFQNETFNYCMVYGDTNSTLAGALAAVKLQIPLAHVEAGLRSYNSAMPEEINRIITDRISNILFCPTNVAVNNLKNESFPFFLAESQPQRIVNVGDVMLDAVLHYRKRAEITVDLNDFGLTDKEFVLCTLHRQENTDNESNLRNILKALRHIAKKMPVVLPLHPRTRAKILSYRDNQMLEGLLVLAPLSYLEMQRLQMSAYMILTDSGGVQKEAFFHEVPCITLREETEWTETLENGWNKLAGSDVSVIIDHFERIEHPSSQNKSFFGDGNAAQKIIDQFSI